MTPETVLAVFEKGDCDRSADDVANLLGLKKATPKIRRILETLAAEGAISREVRRGYRQVWSKARSEVVGRSVVKAYYWIA